MKKGYIDMKKPEEILKSIEEEMPFRLLEKSKVRSYILMAIKEAQIDAIKATVQACADNADADFVPMNWLAEQHVSKPFIEGEDYEIYVIKSSILEVADKLIKELE